MVMTGAQAGPGLLWTTDRRAKVCTPAAWATAEVKTHVGATLRVADTQPFQLDPDLPLSDSLRQIALTGPAAERRLRALRERGRDRCTARLEALLWLVQSACLRACC